MIRVTGPSLRILVAFLWIAAFVQAQPPQGKEPKPPTDDPPIGKGKILFLEDFESTQVGKVPAGFTAQGAVAVVEDISHSGKHSLRMEAATRGPRRITMKSEALAALGGQHWGRLYFKVQLPAPECTTGAIHSTLVSATGMSPLHKDPIEVELVDTILNTQQTFNYL